MIRASVVSVIVSGWQSDGDGSPSATMLAVVSSALRARNFRLVRTSAGLSQTDVSNAVGLSRPQYGRIERGRSPEVSVATLARIAAVLGLDTSLRFYPGSDPVRDAAHQALLERLRIRCHPSLTWRTEVPVIRGFTAPPGRAGTRGAVEAETRPTDIQALDRKLALKERDGGADWLILLLADTRHNRHLLAGPGAALQTRFPLAGSRALELLGAAVDPGANAIVLL